MLKLITCYHTERLILKRFCRLFETGYSQMRYSVSFNLKEDDTWSIISKQF